MKTNAVLFLIAAVLLIGFVFATADMTGKAYAQKIPPGCDKASYTAKNKAPEKGPCAEKPGKGKSG